MKQDVRFPEAKSFDELFTDYIDRGKSDALNRRERDYHTRYPISFSGPDSFEYGSVELKPELKDYVENHMLDIRNLGCFFKVIIRADGSVLVVASYDQIIGSHWLAYIDKSTLPEIES